MEGAGQKLKAARERLRLTTRDVEDATRKIAIRHGSEEFAVGLSRLSEIENRGVMPTIYRLYSLCAVYRIDLAEVLSWYGVNSAALAADAALIEVGCTHLIRFAANSDSDVQLPLTLDPGFDIRHTNYVSRFIQRWGRLPLALLSGLDLKNYRYGFIGTGDWTMYPILYPGSLVLIDERRRKVAASGWQDEHDRPIYFLEHRNGYACGWCSLNGNRLVLLPHPSSDSPPQVYAFPGDIDVIGQVTGVAMRLDVAAKRRVRS
jgi:transcriptional regulator with XRE-family HTH domain